MLEKEKGIIAYITLQARKQVCARMRPNNGGIEKSSSRGRGNHIDAHGDTWLKLERSLCCTSVCDHDATEDAGEHEVPGMG